MTEKDWRPPVGTRVLIRGDRAWSGQSGVIERHEDFFGGSLVVKLDNGMKSGVTRPNEIKILRSGA